MTTTLTRWFLAAALAAGLAAFAENKVIRCKRGCEEMTRVCTESCKQQVKKRAPQTAQYCAPKCNEIKVSCEKDCDDAAIKHKPKR